MLNNDGIIVGCFGTREKEEFDRTFKQIYLKIEAKAKAVTVLALTNKKNAEILKENDFSLAKELLNDCKKVKAIPLFMADGSQYQLFKKCCEECNYDVGLPILETKVKEVAALLQHYYPEKEDYRIVLLAHGNKDYDNHEYRNLQNYLRDDFSICLAEANDSIEDIVQQAKEKHLILFCLMFTCGHHFKEQRELFETACRQYNKQFEVNETPLGGLPQFAEMLIKGEENV